MNKCIITGLPTNRNFKQFPVHPDVLTMAREITDEDKTLTLRHVLSSTIQIEKIKTKLTKRSDQWAKFFHPLVMVDRKGRLTNVETNGQLAIPANTK